MFTIISLRLHNNIDKSHFSTEHSYFFNVLITFDYEIITYENLSLDDTPRNKINYITVPLTSACSTCQREKV